MVYMLIVLHCLHHQACICQSKHRFQSDHGELVSDAADPKWQPQAGAAWPCGGLQNCSACGCHHFGSINGFVVCWDQKRTWKSCNTAYCETQAVVLEHRNSCTFTILDWAIFNKDLSFRTLSNPELQVTGTGEFTFAMTNYLPSSNTVIFWKTVTSIQKRELLTCPEILLVCKLSEIFLNVKSPCQSLEINTCGTGGFQGLWKFQYVTRRILSV